MLGSCKQRERSLFTVEMSVVGVATVLSFTGLGVAAASQSERQLVSTAPAAVGPVDNIVWNLPWGEPSVIDPPNGPTYSGAGVVSNLCDSLLTIDADHNLSPNIAEYKIVSATRIDYTIREGASFWDGTPVTAEDVAFSLQRSALPAQIVSFLYENVESIKVTGDRTVTVAFKRPDQMFNVEMATFAGMVVQKKFTEAAGPAFGTASGGIMCSGPFKFEEWVAGDHILISRNDNYWNKERLPLAKHVRFTFVTDTAAYTQAMKAGEIDGSYEISPSAIPALEKAESGNLYFGPSMQSLALTVANPGGVMADIKLRDAFQSIIDRPALATVIFKGAAIPNYTALTPATWQNEAKQIYADAYPAFESNRKLDEAKASGLVKESTYKGQEIFLAIAAGEETNARIAQLIQQQAKNAGLHVTIKSMQPLEFTAAKYDAAKRAGIDLFLWSSFNAVQDPLEPTGFIYLPGAFYNTSGFEDPEVTRLIAASRQTFDASERAKMFVQMQAIYEKQSGIIPLLSLNTVTFLNKRLAGAVTSFAYMSMPALVYIGAAK